MSVAVQHRVRPHGTSTGRRPDTRVVLVSLAAGLGAAVILTMLVLPGATEGVTAGAGLLGFGLGWAVLRGLSERTTRPQRWATVPAVAMTSTGAALMIVAPSDRTLAMLTWVWPGLALALAVWTYVHARRDLAGAGGWLVTTVLVLLAASSAGAAVRAVTTDSFASTYPAPGVIRSVGDHRLHIDCRGQGQPTVVLVSGLGEFSASWARSATGSHPPRGSVPTTARARDGATTWRTRRTASPPPRTFTPCSPQPERPVRSC
jgi:hypothetical protein